MKEDREYGDDYERPYVSVGNSDGKYLMKWMLVLFSGLILVSVTAGISWAVSIDRRESALEVGQAAMNAKLDYLVDVTKRMRGE